jgi:hypothetical protein
MGKRKYAPNDEASLSLSAMLVSQPGLAVGVAGSTRRMLYAAVERGVIVDPAQLKAVASLRGAKPRSVQNREKDRDDKALSLGATAFRMQVVNEMMVNEMMVNEMMVNEMMVVV